MWLIDHWHIVVRIETLLQFKTLHYSAFLRIETLLRVNNHVSPSRRRPSDLSTLDLCGIRVVADGSRDCRVLTVILSQRLRCCFNSYWLSLPNLFLAQAVWIISSVFDLFHQTTAKLLNMRPRGNIGSHRLNLPNLSLTNKFPQGSSDATCTHSFGTLTRSYRAKAPSFDPLCNPASYQENRRAPDRKSMGAPTNFSSAVTID